MGSCAAALTTSARTVESQGMTDNGFVTDAVVAGFDGSPESWTAVRDLAAKDAAHAQIATEASAALERLK